MGRIKNKKVEFYVDEKELEVIDRRAKTSNLDRSKYLRKVAMQGYKLRLILSI